jgi:tetratricopeptide (TPR) repeat protein
MMDLLEFEAGSLYFEEPINEEAQRCIEQAAASYATSQAESLLLRAYFLEPEHPLVLVALYRYFYYRHRLSDALLIADRVLRVFAARLGLPGDWRDLNEVRLASGVLVSMTALRFYMLALKGAGYLELRLGQLESALIRLKKVAELDARDRLGAQALIDVVEHELSERNHTQMADAAAS